MARLWRVEYAGACYHVINRGNYRRDLFSEEGEARSFEKALEEAATRFRWKVHAFVIMRNHFHLAVELTEANLSVGMQWLQGTWGRRFNNFRNQVGRPFQGRYRAIHVEPGRALARVCDYIHLNPVRAGVVAVQELATFRLSSFYRYTKMHPPRWLDSAQFLDEAGELRADRRGWNEYLLHLSRIQSRGLNHSEEEPQFKRGWCIGSDDFKNQLKRKAAESGCRIGVSVLPGLHRSEILKDRAERWETRLQNFAQRAGIRLNELPPGKSATEKMLLAAAIKSSSDASNIC